MNLFRASIPCCYTRRGLGLLALWVSSFAGGQSLNLAVKDPVLPKTGLSATAASPSVNDDSAESSSAPALEDEALPESPSSTLAALSVRALEPSFADPGQFKTPDPGNYPKTPDGRPIAPLYTKYIPADWGYQPIHGREKLILGARDLYTPANILAIFISTGYSHLVDGQPNYGVNREAFAKRLGATAIRETAEGIFTDGVFSVLFHQDPRYFAEGPKYSFIHRAFYAATRPLIVRSTSGTGRTVNSSLLVGYAAAAALNNAYYPQINRNVKDTFSGYGTSIGGAALGFVVSEFTDDALQLLHLRKR